jgi:hypothetical protein
MHRFADVEFGLCKVEHFCCALNQCGGPGPSVGSGRCLF